MRLLLIQGVQEASFLLVYWPKADTSVNVVPAPSWPNMVDDVRQSDSKAFRVEGRIHTQPSYDISTSEETIVAVLSFKQVVDMTPVLPAACEERGRALTNVRVDASGAFGRMTTRAVDAVEFDAHVEPGCRDRS